MAKNDFKKEDEQLAQVESNLSKAGQWIVDHQNILMYALLGVIVAAMGGYLYFQKVVKPKQEKAAYEISKVAQEPDQNTQLAQYEAIAKKYDNQQGEVAALKAASMHYDNENYDAALKQAKKFSASDLTIGVAAMQLRGDILVNQAKYKDAAKMYKKVAKSGNELIAPMALYKLALVELELGSAKDAKEALETIVSVYPAAKQVVLAKAMLATLE